MSMLSDGEIKQRIIRGDDQALAREWWRKADWEAIGDRLLILPYREECVGPADYDLHLGGECVLLRDPYRVIKLAGGEEIMVPPGDTLLCLTEEFIGLPKTVVGLIVPKVSWLCHGTALHASRVHPTWHGKLRVAMTNLGSNPIALARGDGLCSILFYTTSAVEHSMAEAASVGLGTERLPIPEYPRLRPQPYLEPGQVRPEDISQMPALYGKPFDVVRGALEAIKREVQYYVDHDVAPNLLYNARQEAKAEGFGAFKWLAGILATGILALIVAAIVKMFCP
jgi:deoxycytidine triphosphate deaminase